MGKFISSFRKNLVGIIMMIFSANIIAVGQLLWKLSYSDNIYYLILGFLLYGVGAVLMVMAFRHGSYSVLHPLNCFSYVVGITLGYIFLGEKISVTSIIGITIIIGGVLLIGGGDCD